MTLQYFLSMHFNINAGSVWIKDGDFNHLQKLKWPHLIKNPGPWGHEINNYDNTHVYHK